MVLRLSRELKALDIPDDTSVTSLPSVRKVLEGTGPPADDRDGEEAGARDEVLEMGDDDAEDLETLEAEESALVDDDDLYSDALGDISRGSARTSWRRARPVQVRADRTHRDVQPGFWPSSSHACRISKSMSYAWRIRHLRETFIGL
jgi:hypothetical protein